MFAWGLVAVRTIGVSARRQLTVMLKDYHGNNNYKEKSFSINNSDSFNLIPQPQF